jgi:hypothetical protein
MRTTITLDPDTEALLRREMARTHVNFKRAVNDAIRRGLSGGRSAARDVVKVLPFESDYQPGIDRLRLQQLADDLELDAAAARANRHS